MLLNCTCCGKLISLKKDLCPYCMTSLETVKASLKEEVVQTVKFRRRRYTFFGLLSR